MPTYDYICSDCNIRFELFQHMKEKPVSNCPECGGNVKRLIGTGAGTIFKGSGFYHTDYKKPTPKPNQTNETNEKKSSQSKEATNKPETVTKNSEK